ncbi:hypothetical protein [Kitasatospora sp. NPDC057936]|uniref:hypothetical protein n=1 Tax=Kitasatospora sp. NPDC057936 TaxID=3346283 RepID=UPI0036DE0CA7
MPEHYSSIGEAIGAAMQHNIRLAHGPAVEPPLRVRYFPPPAADPLSLPGMVSRLEVTASPDEVAGIIEEVTGALVGPLTQLTELVAASADWARARIHLAEVGDFEDPAAGTSYGLWARLASAHKMLTIAQQDLEGAVAPIAAAPAQLTDPRNHEPFQVLRTRELLHDVMGSVPPSTPEAQRCQAAIAGSPGRVPQPSTTTATAQSTAPVTGPAAAPRRTR